jgi:hypothetical protein
MIIAEKSLRIQRGDETRSVTIKIHAPHSSEDCWTCRYEIGWPEAPRQMDVHGADSAQALVLAMFMIGADLYCSSYHARGELIGDGMRGDFGFPVSAIIRDRASGYVEF